jgi:hypothetical protein
VVFWWGWDWVAALVSGLVWIVLLLVGVILLRRELPHLRRHALDSPALHLLEERYARGEITRAEFLERRDVLLSPSVDVAEATRPPEARSPVENAQSFDDTVAGEPIPRPPPVAPGGYAPVAPPPCDLDPAPPPSPETAAAAPSPEPEPEPPPEPVSVPPPETYAGVEPTLQLPAAGPEEREVEERPTASRKRVTTAKKNPPAHRRRPAT